MSYEDEMQEYHDEMADRCQYKITYTVSNGVYYANSIWGLVWEVYSHRFWHLFRHGRWMD
jgi:hypothetical protein